MISFVFRYVCLFLLAFICYGALSMDLHAQTIYRVKDDGSATADGSTWVLATSLHAALAAATAGDTLWLAGGNYVPTDSAGMIPTNPRHATFEVAGGLSLYGGFAGTEAALTDRDETLIHTDNKTTLSGERGSADDDTDNIKGIVLISSGELVTLDGLAVEKGYGGSWASSKDDDGAGIFVRRSTELLLHNCRLSNNTVLSTETSAPGVVQGAAMHAQSPFTLSNCVFSNNSVLVSHDNVEARGGALSADVMSSILDSEFSANQVVSTSLTSRASGGAVATRADLSITDSDCLNNSASATLPSGTSAMTSAEIYGGAISTDRALTIVGSTFFANSVSSDHETYVSNGGALYARGAISVTGSTF